MGQPLEQPASFQEASYQQMANPGLSSTRLLHIYHEGFIHRQMHVLDSDKSTPLYHTEQKASTTFSSKPHMTVRNANNSLVVGTVSFHTFSRRIDLTIHGQSIELAGTSLMTIAHQFKSPRGNVLKWKSDGVFSGGDMVCIDETADPRAQLVARFQWRLLSVSKSGRLEVSSAVQGVALDEVVISGLAMFEYQRRRNSSSGGGGAGGAA